MEKKTFLTTILVFVVMQAYSQSYIPLIVEGKTWNLDIVGYNHEADEMETESITCVLSGDTVFNGVAYKKYYENDTFMGGMREKNKCVYYTQTGEAKEMLIYDFNLEVGEEFTYYDCVSAVTNVTTINAHGKALKCIELTDIYNPHHVHYWIEGVGGIEGPTRPLYEVLTGASITMNTCTSGDSVLYSKEDNPTAIALPTPSTPSALYDLQGRKLNGKPRRGLYLKDGRKMVAN